MVTEFGTYIDVTTQFTHIFILLIQYTALIIRRTVHCDQISDPLFQKVHCNLNKQLTGIISINILLKRIIEINLLIKLPLNDSL